MSSLAFTVLFVTFLIISLLVRFWLASRHVRHILANRAAVPPQFVGKIPLEAHQKAADYSIAKTKFALFVVILVRPTGLFGQSSAAMRVQRA